MNIADKRLLYEEIYRVLNPGGRYAFQEMTAGKVATSYFPLPWATDPATDYIIFTEAMPLILKMQIHHQESIKPQWRPMGPGAIANTNPPGSARQCGLGSVRGQTLGKRPAERQAQLLEEGQVRLVQGVPGQSRVMMTETSSCSVPAVMRNYTEVLRNDLAKVLARLAASQRRRGLCHRRHSSRGDQVRAGHGRCASRCRSGVAAMLEPLLRDSTQRQC